MMKLCWRFQSNPNSLWAKSLRFKYVEDNSSNLLKSGTSTLSLLWKGMLDVAEETIATGSWSVGCGTGNWLEDFGPLINLVYNVDCIINPEARIVTIAPNGCWDSNMFYPFLPLHVVEKIMSYHISNRMEEYKLV